MNIMSKKPFVTIVIPTYNGSKTIGNCLESIKNQTYKNTEIILVDNNSLDNTKKIAKKYTKYVYNKGPERSVQRNFGAKKGKGEYVFFIDQDMILKPNVISQCINAAKKYRAVIIPEISFGIGFWSKCKHFERSLYSGNNNVEIARFFEKKLFEKIGKYDESFTGPEDYALNNEVIINNIPIGRIKEEILHDEGKLTLKRLVKKRIHYGRHFKRYAQKYPDFAKKQVGIGRAKSLLKPQILKNPLLTSGMIFMKTCEFLANKWGMFLGDYSK